MGWKPQTPGEAPTLGWQVIDWIAEELNSPDSPERRPFILTREQEDFCLRWYEVDPATGRFRYDRGLIGRPRGWGKSPLLGAFALAEGLAPVLFDGWDADGQPVGKPWATLKQPLVHVAAVSEEQTNNTWSAILGMLDEAPALDDYPGLDPMLSGIILPSGRIDRVTAAYRTLKGARSVFAVLDQTEEWVPSNRGPTLAQTIRTNCDKMGGRTLESPNAFVPGEESVAEESANYASNIKAGKTRQDKLLYDHREAPASTDLTDRGSLIEGLRYAYGDSSDDPAGCLLHDPPCKPGWALIETFADRFWDPAYDVQQLRADFLNQITHASDSWLSRPEWMACQDLDKTVVPSDQVVLGFDGSRGRVRGRADATALVGCRVADGHVFEVRVWEAPTGPGNRDWLPPVTEVDATVRDCFDRWDVIGFYADPSGWTSQVAGWEAEYGPRLRVRSGRSPIAVWPRGKDTRAAQAVEETRQAVVGGELTHDGSAALTRHVLNARRRRSPGGYLLYKQYPESPAKIDAAYAMVMAWKARTDAVAAGAGLIRPRRQHAIFA